MKTLTCGSTKCRTDAAYCEHTHPGQRDAETTHTCKALPEGCTDCSCLSVGGAASCTKSESGIEVTISLP